MDSRPTSPEHRTIKIYVNSQTGRDEEGRGDSPENAYKTVQFMRKHESMMQSNTTFEIILAGTFFDSNDEASVTALTGVAATEAQFKVDAESVWLTSANQEFERRYWALKPSPQMGMKKKNRNKSQAPFRRGGRG